MLDPYYHLAYLIVYHNKKNRQGCMVALHMQHVLDGFFFYDILLVKPDN